MSLRWRQFEGETRRALKRQLRQARSGKKQKASTIRRNYGRAIALPLFVLYGWAAITLGYGGWAANRLGSGLLSALVTSVPLTLFMAAFWHARLAAHPEPIWYVLPLSRAHLYRLRTRQFNKSFLYWGTLVLFAYLAIYVRGEIHSVSAAFALGVAQTIVIWTCALHLAAGFPTFMRSLARLGLLALLVIGLGPTFGITAAALREAGPTLAAILPAGWTHHALAGSGWRDRVCVIPLALLLAAIPFSLRRLRTQFFETIFWQPEASDDESSQESVESIQHAALLQNGMRGRSWREVCETLVAELLRSNRPREEWIEMLVENVWSEEQRELADFLWCNRRGWTIGWKRAVKSMAVCFGLGAVARFVFEWPIAQFVVLTAGGLLALQAAPILPSANAFRSIPSTGAFSPLYAPFPVSASAIYRTLRAAAIVRWIAWMPLAIIYGAAIAAQTGVDISHGGGIGLGCAALTFALQPAFITMAMGRNTTIVSAGWKLIFACLVFLVLSLVAVFIVALLEPAAGGWPVIVGACIAIWISSKSAQLLREFLYRRRGIDQLHRPQAAYSSSR
jgi:hypothetical protein